MTNQFDVFLCHNSQDIDKVRSIGLHLEKEGLRPWLNEWELTPGRSWQKALEEQIKTVKAAAVFISNSGDAPWLNLEMEALLREFVKRNCPVIPVILEGSAPELPIFLDGMTWVDFTQTSPDPMAQLIWGITGRKPDKKGKRRLKDGLFSGQAGNESPEALLKELNQERIRLKKSGMDTTQIDQERIDLKRKIRYGIYLEPDDYLDNGRYQLAERIGVGGFAEVWKAWDSQSERFVAIKVLHAQYCRDQTRLERFFRGARQMAKLNHPGIVDVYEPFKEENGRKYFIMSYMEGGDLRRAILNGRIKKEEVIPIIIEVGKSLAYAHSQDVIHRDLKPENILLDGRDKPRLSDFDLVKTDDTTGGTRTGALGSFIYSAPECHVNAKEAGPQADVYGLAMTAVSCLMKCSLSIDIIKNTERYLKKLPCGYQLKKVLAKGLNWDIEARYSTIIEFCSQLENAFETDPNANALLKNTDGLDLMVLDDDLKPLLKQDLLGIEVGYALIPLVENENEVLERLQKLRHKLAIDIGIIVPPIRIRDNLQLEPNQYRFLIKGAPLSHESLMLEHFLALDPEGTTGQLEGILAKEPAFGLNAWWIEESQREGALEMGYTVVDPTTVITTHLAEIIKSYAHEILGRQDTQYLVENLAESYPKIVEDLIPTILPLGTVQKVLQNLLAERVSIRDLLGILEALAAYGNATKDPYMLTELVRQSICRSIVQPFVDEKLVLTAFSLQPELETILSTHLIESELGSYLALSSEQAESLVTIIREVMNPGDSKTSTFPLMISSSLRRPMRVLIGKFMPYLTIISPLEVPPGIQIVQNYISNKTI